MYQKIRKKKSVQCFATQVYDQKSTKIKRKNPIKDPPTIVFFAAEGPWFNLGAYWVVKPLKCLFYYLKGRGPLKSSKKFAEMWRNIWPIDWYHSTPPLFSVYTTFKLTQKAHLACFAAWNFAKSYSFPYLTTAIWIIFVSTLYIWSLDSITRNFRPRSPWVV